MTQKHSLETVKKYIEAENFRLLSEEYQNTKSKLQIECPKGHRVEVAFSKFRAGIRCKFCSGKMKWNQKTVSDFVQKEGFRLLSNYKSNHSKMRLRCPQGHFVDISLSNFRYGTRCKFCSKNDPKTQEQVRIYVESRGYQLLSKYKSRHSKVKLKCPQNHVVEMLYNNFRRGANCKYCVNKNLKFTYQMVKDYIESYNYKLKSVDYQNSHEKLEIICPKGHTTNMLFYSFKHGSRCSLCAPERQKQSRIQNESTFAFLSGKTVSDYAEEYCIPRGTLQRYLTKYNPTEQDFIKYCESWKTSLTNIEFLVQSKIGLVKYNKRPMKKIKYRPDFKLSDKLYLNTDGLYWHSEKHRESKYHFNMRKTYENNDLFLFQFREDELCNKLPIVKSMLDCALNNIDHKFYARKCDLKSVPSSDAQSFLEQNHIMGSFISAKHIGLYYNDKLISIMSYKLQNNILKISRFCSKRNTIVTGALSKMLKYLEKNINPNQIHYWVDLRYGNGNGLTKLGFEKIRDTLGWKWTDGYNTYNRLKCRANMDERKLSQAEHAKELGWYKIYDAGQRLYIKQKL